MPNYISEDDIEKSCINILTSKNDYKAIDCYTKDKENLNDNSGRISKKEIILPIILQDSLERLNPTIPKETVCKITEELRQTRCSLDLSLENYNNYQIIKNGITVEYEKDGKTKKELAKIIDFKNTENNDFTVASQFWIEGIKYWRRPDLIIFINGLPLVFIELKNANIAVKNAYDDNLTNYKNDIPQLFLYNQISILSNGLETRIGSFSAGYEHFFEWLKIENEKENPNRKKIKEDAISLEYTANGLLKKERLLDYIENFILFETNKKSYFTKIIAKNHQFLGVNNAYYAFLNREKLAGKLGIFWHTQGSGKSYSMIMLAKKIKHLVNGNFTFLIVTDRKDLDIQIWKNFLKTEFMSNDENVQPANGATLRKELQGNKTVLFTLIHKFGYEKGNEYPVLSTRDDIIIFVDEAHRTQYKDLAENMRKGLPNAQYFAFTGTPLLGSKRLTHQWFGDYVSEYNFAESVKDGATVPLYYVNAMKEVQLVNPQLDDEITTILENEELTPEESDRLLNYYAKQMEVIKRDDRLETIAKHIAHHFPRRGFKGKAMIVSVDKFTAVKMYDKVNYYWKEELKAINIKLSEYNQVPLSEVEKKELIQIRDYMKSVKMAVVISEEIGEEEKFANEGLQIKPHRQRMQQTDENGFDIEDNFKNPEHPLQLVFVCSMWLTGFDAPSVSTLYLDKPMQGHTLMQAIARANRVFPNKKCGTIVGYMDVFQSLKKALLDYASDDTDNTPVKEIDVLFSKLLEIIETTKKFCATNGVDLTVIAEKDETFASLNEFEDAANILVSNDEVKNEFRVCANTVSNLYEALKPEIFNMNFDATYKEIILYLKDVIDGKIRPEKIEKAKQKMSELLDESVIAEKNNLTQQNTQEQIELLQTADPIDLSKIDIEELSKQIKKSKHKNLKIQDLRTYIDKKLALMIKTNITRKSFAERFKAIIDEYNAGGSQNDDFFKKLVAFMKELQEEESRHIQEDLSEAELEIFDLLQKEKLTKDELQKVKLAAKTLYQTLQEKRAELFIVGWEKDMQPKERIRTEIRAVLDNLLPDSYNREIFATKTDEVFNHIVDQAQMGLWVA